MFYLSPPTPLLPQAPQAIPAPLHHAREGEGSPPGPAVPHHLKEAGSGAAGPLGRGLLYVGAGPRSSATFAEPPLPHGAAVFRPAETLPPVSCPGTSSQSQALPTRGQALFWKVSTRAGILGPRVLPATEVPGDASCLLSWDRVSFLGAAATTICLPGLPSQGFQQKPV